MNRYFRLNPDVDVGLDLWRDVNLLCQSLHSDDVEDFWRTQDEWIVSSWKLYPKSSVHVLDLTNGKTVYMFVDKTVQDGLRQSYECLASAPFSDKCFQLTMANILESETGSPVSNWLCCNSNPLLAVWVLPKILWSSRHHVSCNKESYFQEGTALGKDFLNPLNVTSYQKLDGGWPSPEQRYSSSSIPADYVSAGHVLVSADRDRIC
ncbi:hypothetical protein Tco_0992595 [Tanacetum coccineum]|uniref:Uncharacterized protein n=1 Tax=Tanacetum coccineum TaxID=301880 RepID=A0ABQ5F2J2_9ASTR